MASRSATKLIVYAACFMLLCTDDEESSECILLRSSSSFELHDACECTYSFIDLDISSTSCHIRCYRHSTICSCFCDDFCFARVLLSIEYFMRYSLFCQKTREIFAFCDRYCSYENRLSLLMEFSDKLYEIRIFPFFCTK